MPVIRRPLNLTPAGPAINVTLMEHFLRIPPVYFTKVARPKHRRQYLSHDPARITSCARSMKKKFPDSKGGCLKVSTTADLEKLTQTFLTLPIFLTATLRRERTKYKNGSKTIVITTAKVAVVVNTQHVHIQQHLETLLGEAMELMRKGKNFAVEFDFNTVLEEWFESVFVSQDNSSFGSPKYTSKHARITVTNYGEKPAIFTLNCSKSLCSLLCWMSFFPCCMVTCPIYRLQRAIRVTDRGGPVPEELYATPFCPALDITDDDAARSAYVRRILQQFS